MKSTYFGLTSFDKSLQTRAQAYTLVQNTLFPVILGFEYYPVITLGQEMPLSAAISELQGLGFQVRDSQGTRSQLHSPGQLVIHPLVPLKQLGLNQKVYLEVLIASIQSWLKSLGLETEIKSESSLWTSKGRIALIEGEIEENISQQAISINISNDLSLLSRSQINNISEDSLAQQNIPMDLKMAFDAWVSHFTAHLLSAMPSPGGPQQ